MALVESKHEHSSRSSCEAHAYRSLGLTLGGGTWEDMSLQEVNKELGSSKENGALGIREVKRQLGGMQKELFV